MMVESLLAEEEPSSSSYYTAPLEEVSPSELLGKEQIATRVPLLPGFNRSCSMDSTKPEKRPIMIDNSNLTYIPMYLSCGVTVNCRPDVLVRCPQILRDIDLDVKQCLSILPRSTHNLVRRTNIWVNTTYYYGPCMKPQNVNHSTAHHHQAWLLSVYDRADKAPGIEIYNCFDYRKMRWHWNGCGLLLHELCHIIHQFCLGLDDARIEYAYEQAKQTGKYATTLRRDWAGLDDGDTDMAYALVNAKEFFAELSVAYWSQGYDEHVSKDDRTKMRDASPPFTAPSVISRLDPQKYPIAEKALFVKSFPWFRTRLCLPPHCNKFYPFTRVQFHNMDPDMFDLFDLLWEEIANWNGDREDRAKCWPFC